MANINQKFGTSNQSITISLLSLANGTSRASTAVDNSTDLFADALVSINIKSGASGTASTGYVTVYAYGTVDGGTNYTENATNGTGLDAAITLTSPTNLKVVGIINVVANATTYRAGPFSIAQVFGGSLPQKWGIVITNSTGGALDSTEANHLKIYQGIYNQVN
jgi:hypothetical protein